MANIGHKMRKRREADKALDLAALPVLATAMRMSRCAYQVQMVAAKERLLPLSAACVRAYVHVS